MTTILDKITDSGAKYVATIEIPVDMTFESPTLCVQDTQYKTMPYSNVICVATGPCIDTYPWKTARNVIPEMLEHMLMYATQMGIYTKCKHPMMVLSLYEENYSWFLRGYCVDAL